MTFTQFYNGYIERKWTQKEIIANAASIIDPDCALRDAARKGDLETVKRELPHL